MTRSSGATARTRTTAGAVVVGPLLGAALLLTGCTSDIGASGDQGYVSGKGVITALPASERTAPGPVRGTTLSGKEVSLGDYRGKVVVVNVWGSWCAPCRKEAPMLADASRELADRGVVFLGINSRDTDPSLPRAFERRYGLPYESIYDPGGRTLLAFHGTLPPNSIPSTVVVDRSGRVAAGVNGDITRTTLEDLVEDASGSAAPAAPAGEEGA